MDADCQKKSLITTPFDTAEITRYFNFLDAEQHFCVGFFDADSKNVISGYGKREGTVTEIIEWLAGLWNSGFEPTLHVTLNRTKAGRKRENIESCRVLCVDLDRTVSKDEIAELSYEHAPAFVVCSSPGKYHLYWKCSDAISLEQWSKYQLALAAHFDGDLNLRDITKTIRVPGVQRRCKDGTVFMPLGIARGSTVEILNDLTIGAKWPWIEEAYARGLQKLTESKEAFRAQMKTLRYAMRKRIAGEVPPARVKIQAEGRNITLYKEVNDRCVENRWNLESAQSYAVEVNSLFEQPLDAVEVRKTAKSAWEHSVEYLGRVKERSEKERVMIEERLVSEPVEVVAPLLNGHDQLPRAEAVPILYNTETILQRLIDWYGERILADNEEIFAYCVLSKRWVHQSQRNKNVLSSLVDATIGRVIRERDFLDLGMDNDGNFSASRYNAHVEKISKIPFRHGLVEHLLRLGNSFKQVNKNDFDGANHLFYCTNGILNLKDGTLHAPSPEHLMMKKGGVPWNPEAECPKWLLRLQQTFARSNNPQELIRQLQEICGYTLGGSIGAQKVFVHHGLTGSNGKSGVMTTLMTILGEYCWKINWDEIFTGTSKFSSAKVMERVAVQLEGRRAIIIDEVKQQVHWDEAMIKSFTGENVTARKLYHEAHTVVNRAKFHVFCNRIPTPESESDALTRRLALQPYAMEFISSLSENERLQAEALEELSGIFRWMVEGYMQIQKNGGIRFSAEGELIVEEYKEENSFITNTINDLWENVPRGTSADAHWEKAADLQKELNEALVRAGLGGHSFSRQEIGILLKKREIQSRRVDRGKEGKCTEYQLVRKRKAEELSLLGKTVV